MKKLTDSSNRYTVMLLGLLLVILATFSILKFDMLWKVGTAKSMSMQFPEYGVMTLGVMICFISGNIDMSFVALGDFASILAAQVMLSADNGSNTGMVIVLSLLVACLVGGVGGYLNGTLISRLGIPPILATLASQQVFSGIATAITQGNAVTGLPDLYSEIGHTYLFGFLPVPLLVFFAVFLVIAFILRFTTYGEKLYMTGANPKAAKFSAINTTTMVNSAFVLNGICAAIGCMLMVSTMNSAKADYGSSYLMRCILILVLAGVMPDGGLGKIFNVLVSVVIIQIIATCVNMFPGLNSYYSSLIWGALLLIVLMVNTKLLGGSKKFKKAKVLPDTTQQPTK